MSCPVCTFVNEANWVNCSVCGSANPSVVIHTSVTAGGATACPVCTFENPAGAFQCGVCASPLKGGAVGGATPMLDDSGPGWRCPACTMWQEDLDDPTCLVCNTVNVKIEQAIEERERKKQEEHEKKQKEIEEEKKKTEVERKRKEKQKVADTVMVLEAALLMLKSAQYNNGTIQKLLDSLYSYIDTSEYPPKQAKATTECAVCGSEFDGECKAITITHCGHRTACGDCFGQYVTHRIREKDVLPFVRCPEPDCKVNLLASELVCSGVTGEMLCTLIVIHATKTLSREEDWVVCLTDKCQNGFLLPPLPPPQPVAAAPVAEKTSKRGKGSRFSEWVPLPLPAPVVVKPVKLTCGVCKKEQNVQRKPEELDAEFKKMIQDGTLRPCPKCQHMTLKEYGVCNVIECVKCAIWWNWRSRDTGSTSAELKNRARSTGTLWEAGELAFQQKLEQSDPKKFRALLERNGVKYDPHYTRGT